ncbi:MAG: prepilin-type N-terminal cleavage/methylation domain-containing protein [Armatimonadota bacterium]|nr:prepilin-type N-terminal cleavage/methylation domain-containing protein [Armatimonadota bacterium]
MLPPTILVTRGLRTRRCGFTLVEVLAAAALLSIGLLAVVATSGTAREYHRRAALLSVGRAVAQNRIEKLRSMPVSSLPAQAGTASDPVLPKGNSVVTTVSGYPTADETDLYRVVVRVSWPEGGGTRTITYETLIARK